VEITVSNRGGRDEAASNGGCRRGLEGIARRDISEEKITRTPRVTIVLFEPSPFGRLDPRCVFRVHDPGLGVLHGTRGLTFHLRTSEVGARLTAPHYSLLRRA